MEPTFWAADAVDGEQGEHVIVHAWRAEQLLRLGLPRQVAEAFADFVDWREVARLVDRGCPVELALEIVR